MEQGEDNSFSTTISADGENAMEEVDEFGNVHNIIDGRRLKSAMSRRGKRPRTSKYVGVSACVGGRRERLGGRERLCLFLAVHFRAFFLCTHLTTITTVVLHSMHPLKSKRRSLSPLQRRRRTGTTSESQRSEYVCVCHFLHSSFSFRSPNPHLLLHLLFSSR